MIYVPAGRLSRCSRTQKQGRGGQQRCPHSCHSLGTLGDSSYAVATSATCRASSSSTGDFQPFCHPHEDFPRSITPKHDEQRHPAGASTQREGGSASGTELAPALPGGWERWQKIHLQEHEVNADPLCVGSGRAKHHRARGAHRFWTHTGMLQVSVGENASKFRGSASALGRGSPSPMGEGSHGIGTGTLALLVPQQRSRCCPKPSGSSPIPPRACYCRHAGSTGEHLATRVFAKSFPSPGSLEPC